MEMERQALAAEARAQDAEGAAASWQARWQEVDAARGEAATLARGCQAAAQQARVKASASLAELQVGQSSMAQR